MIQDNARGDGSGSVVDRGYGDLDEMAAAVRHADVEYLPLAAPSSAGSHLLRVDLEGGATLQIARMGFAHVAKARIHPDVWEILAPLEDGGPPRSWNGQPADASSAMIYRPGADIQAAAQGPDARAALMVPTGQWERAMTSLAGAPLRPFPDTCRMVRMDQASRARLTSLLERVLRVAQEDPGALAGPEARRSLTDSLLGWASRAVERLPERPPERERTLLSHSRTVALAEEFMRSRLALPLYVADLCLATGVSERTLRSAFRNVYGTSPNRFLKLRRLMQVRRTLQRSPGTLVSEVATRHGFWDLGRFAGDYRTLFGETPSQTLRGGAPPARA
jgi:AraC family ethanolamine operon transcriptional activator